jgi:hypothetical protein
MGTVDMIDKLIELFSDSSIEEIEIVCCDKNGPCLRTSDKVLNVKGVKDESGERYDDIEIKFEHFTWTFHHHMPIHSVIAVSDNEYRVNYTNPFICGQFLIRLYRKDDHNGSPS